ncbi:MAG: segregation and condensation protein A [Flammeovirgaceae bacterium]
MSFEVKIPLFEGPFDLLLFFIKRDELDIHDIPISKITNDFLDYIHHLERMNMDVASEFILVAATLMRIKAKMLLPRVEVDEEGNEIDPREELVRHLLEYKKYKSVLGELEKWEGDMLNKEKRGNVVKELQQIGEVSNVETELQDLDLYKILKVYQRLMTRFANRKETFTHQVVPYPYKISDQKTMILERLVQSERLSFEQIIAFEPNKIAVIFNFLAILELMQLRMIHITVGEGFNNFWVIRKGEDEEAEVKSK